ncbi:uncharacterized protein LOC127094811 [Lathyrus oleraceus]|uniref:uncharacterized protein LOC127094811 n=1 Tax=Pisum sativum TaxID=3888 RepID=UPI0021CFA449|nr:uncharacterized protein LOC127094811 [Pisum sativum]
MSKNSGSTPSKITIDQSPPRIACANVDHSNVLTDVVPLTIALGYIPTKRRAKTPTVKKARPKFVASTKGYVVPKVVGSVESFGKILLCYVTTSLAQTDHHIETPLEKSDGKSDCESVPIKSPEKYEEKDDSDSMYVDMSDKEEKSGVKKDQSTSIINIDDQDSDDEPIGKRMAPGMAKRLKSRKGKVVESTSKPPKAPKKSKSVGPTKGWSKVVTLTMKKSSLKRKKVPSSSSDSEYDIEQNVQDIMPLKKVVGKQFHANVPEVPIDNISFHYVENVEKWKFVYQRRLALERELGKDALECKEVVSLIENVRLMKSVASFGKCYKILVKEFIMNISKDCDNKRSKKFRKVYVRANIATGLGKFIYIVGTKTKFDIGSYVFEKTLKHPSTFAVKMPITFPSLICGIVMSQHSGVLINSDATSKRESSISSHYRLFVGTHVPDIVMTSGKKYITSTSRTRIIAELKDTCKTLDETIKACTEKKSMLEILINALSEEDAEGNLDGDQEEYKEVEEDFDASDDDVAETATGNGD